MPIWAQVMFFGALLSAILSTASGALLAPTALFTENVLRPFAPKLSDRAFLLALRIVLVIFTVCALLFAVQSRSTMYEMVQNAYNVTLAGAFIPLLAGAYWKRATTQGALLSIVLGIGTWLRRERRRARDDRPGEPARPVRFRNRHARRVACAADHPAAARAPGRAGNQ